MNQKNLSNWLKGITIGIGLCGIYVYFGIIPNFGKQIITENPEFAFWYYPWLYFIWVTAIPCYLALYHAWNIFCEIGKDNSFSNKNAKLLKRISHLAAIDSFVFLVGNFVFLALNMNHPAIVLASFVIVFFGVAIAVASAALSHLVYKAAKMREENDLTI